MNPPEKNEAAAPPGRPLRVAAIADLHYNKHAEVSFEAAFLEASTQADVLLLCGDLTDYGLPEEAELLMADVHAT